MPDSAPPNLQEFARRLLAFEAASGKRAGARYSAAFRVCEKLRGPLGELLGVGGFRALFTRALALAGAEVPCLRTLEIKANGSLQGLDELDAKLDARGVAEGEVALVAQLLGLLMTFIGRALTLGLVRRTWHKADFEDIHLGK